MAPRLDTQYLERHGNQWRVRLKVPERLRPVIGKAALIVPLHTDNLAIANRDKLKHVIALREMLDKAEAELRRRKKLPPDPITEEAVLWRKAVEEDDDHGTALHALEARAEEIRRRAGGEKASDFVQIALGTATPVSSMIDAWLAERPLKPRQKIDYRRAVLKFEGWLAATKQPGTLEHASRKVAGRYISEQFVTAGVNSKTANKDISCLSGYWKWLQKKGFVQEIIWREQSLPKLRAAKGEGKRPYTDQELKALLSGDAKPLLLDAMRMACFSGMRVDEIARIRVGDIQGDVIEIKQAKTGAGERIVPVHPELTGIIQRRTKGKQPGDFLFDELPTPEKGSAMERSQPIVKAFVYYRRKLKVDDRVEGARQSRVDFHSFRRWFAAKARDALNAGAVGFSAWTLAEVMGHQRDDMPLGMTMSRYAGDDSLAAKRACVEAVKLPPVKS